MSLRFVCRELLKIFTNLIVSIFQNFYEVLFNIFIKYLGLMFIITIFAKV